MHPAGTGSSGAWVTGCDCLDALFPSHQQARRYTSFISVCLVLQETPLAMIRCSNPQAGQGREGPYPTMAVKLLFFGNVLKTLSH